MEVSTRSAAAQLGLSQRQVQRLARGGRITHRSIAGRTVVAERSLLAASRSGARGRRWSADTAAAACELLERGATERISGSQRSRLRARLRTIPVADLAYQVLGNRVTLWRSTRPGPEVGDAASDGFSATGVSLDVRAMQNVTAFARRSRLLEDADGRIVLVELDTDAPTVAEDIARYAYGDARMSGAARQRIEARQADLG